MKTILLIKYGELNTKGGNQRAFIRKLEGNIHNQLKSFGTFTTSANSSRLLIEGKFKNIDKTIAKLQKTPGIEKISNVYSFKKLSSLAFNKFLLSNLKDSQYKTFKIKAIRADKNFAKTSMKIQKEVGEFVNQNTNLKVNLQNPDITIFVEIRINQTFLYFQNYKGTGGLPVGSSANVMVLLSGGIDSPVVAYELLKRGCKVDLIHFTSPPSTDEASIKKVINLSQELKEYSSRINLTIVDINKIQNEIFCTSIEKYRIILLRKVFYSIASKICNERKISALATGESIGQVASQTLESIQATSSDIGKLIFRPLITTNKSQIVKLAKKIGTYDISIGKGQDCCLLFVPKQPVTKPKVSVIKKEYNKLIIENLIDDAIKSAKIIELK